MLLCIAALLAALFLHSVGIVGHQKVIRHVDSDETMVVRSEKPDLADGDQTMTVHPDKPDHADADQTMMVHPDEPNHADAISEHEIPISPVTHV
jgi:hypothetical protein